MRLGCHAEARSLFWWFMQATALTEPEVHVLYRLDGGVGPDERSLALARLSRVAPVRVGNGALEQDAARHLRRAARDRVVLQRRGARARSRYRRRSRPHRRSCLRHLAAARFRHLGGAQRPVSLHPLEGDVLGGARSRGEDGRRRRAAGAPRRALAARGGGDPRLRRMPNAGRSELRSYTRIAGSRDVDASLLMLPLVGYGDPRRRAHSRHDRRGQPPAARRRLRLSLSRRRWRRRAGRGAS